MKKVFSFLKSNLFYAGMTKKEYNMISNEINESNRQTLKNISILASVFLLGMTVLSLFPGNAERNRNIYIVSTAVQLCVLLLSKFCTDGRPRLTSAAVYISISTLLGFGNVLGTLANENKLTVSFIAILLTVPLLYICRPINLTVCIFANIALFVVMAKIFEPSDIYSTDAGNAVIFGIIGCIIGTAMMRVKCKRYLYEKKIAYLSEIDLLTGLRNRNSFESNLCAYANLSKINMYCVFLDVNGLHEVNNREGHIAGDTMLKYIAAIMQNEFGENDTYRIGGDEFTAFIWDIQNNEVQQKIERINRLAEEKGYSVSAAYGIANSPDVNISNLVKEAETRMYDVKTRYYGRRADQRTARTKL